MDRRQVRTRKRLRTSIISLMQEKPLEEVRVLDIVEKADIVLPTFYRNYKNKFDLLQDAVANFTEDFEIPIYHQKIPLEQVLDPTLPPPILPLLMLINHHKNFIKQVIKYTDNQLLFETAARKIKQTIAYNTPELSAEEIELMVGCIMGLIQHWLFLDLDYTVVELAQKIHWTSIYGVLLMRKDHEAIQQMLRNTIRN